MPWDGIERSLRAKLKTYDRYLSTRSGDIPRKPPLFSLNQGFFLKGATYHEAKRRLKRLIMEALSRLADMSPEAQPAISK